MPLLASGTLAHITTLDVSDCAWVTCDVLSTLAGRDGVAAPLPALTSLDLSRCCNAELDAWDARAGRALRPLAPQLRVLSLERCTITPLSLLRIAPHLRSLVELNLAGCLLFHSSELDEEIGSDGSVEMQRVQILVALEAIGEHRRLQRLDLSGNRHLLHAEAHEMQLRTALLPLAGVLLIVDVSECHLDDPDLLAVGGASVRNECMWFLSADWCNWSEMVRVLGCAVTTMKWNLDEMDAVAFAVLGATRGFIFAQVRHPGWPVSYGMVMLPLARTACAGGLYSAWVSHGKKVDLEFSTHDVMSLLLRACVAFHDVDDDAPRKLVLWYDPQSEGNPNGPAALFEGRALNWPALLDREPAVQVPQLLEMVRNAERRLGSGVCMYEEEETQAEAEEREKADLRQGTHPIHMHRVAQPPGVPVPEGGELLTVRRAAVDAEPAPAWQKPGALCAAWGRSDCARCRAWRA